MKVHQAVARLCELFRVWSVGHLHRSSGSTGTYKPQPVGTRVRLGVLGDVPIWHPRTHDAKRKQHFGNFDDGEHVRMRI